MNIRFTGGNPQKNVNEVIYETFENLFQEDDKVIYLDADLMGSLKTADLWQKYPKNVFNVGIQEANMVGVACGMFLNGHKPYIHSFAPFVSRRVFDQLFVSAAYAKKRIHVIGSDAGIMATMNGGTHMCFEDIAMLRTIPNVCIIDVSDPSMCGFFMRSTKDYDGIVYIRTPRRGLPDIYYPDEQFEVGKAKTLIEGKDVSIIACGIMVGTAIMAAQKLKKEGISVRVVDIVTIKPIDKETIQKCADETRGIVSAENASVNGGLGGAIAEVLSTTHDNNTKLSIVGVEDKFGCVGSEAFLRKTYGLDVESLMDAVRRILA